MAPWRFGTQRHDEGLEEIRVLGSLNEEADVGEAARMVAEASAANLPKGNKTAARYLADPVRSFAVREAIAGSVDGVRAMFVWIGPKGGRFDRDGGSHAGTTFAFASLPRTVPWAEAWPRPQWVPVSPDLALGHEEFDARYMIAGDDPARTFTTPVIEEFLAAADETFAWASIWNDHVCAHGIHAPGADWERDRLVDFTVSVSRAMGNRE